MRIYSTKGNNVYKINIIEIENKIATNKVVLIFCKIWEQK